MSDIELGMVYKALLGDESECGDIGIIKKYGNNCFLALVDILGHGSEARKVALYAKTYLENNYCKDIVDIMNGLHEHLKGTRGAVAAICNLDMVTGELSYVGIGNITVRIMWPKPIRFVSKGGVIGYRITNPHKHSLKLHGGEILLLHSDGIKEHFESFECRGLLKENAENIAQGILEKFSKKNDDESCIVLKYLI